MMSLARPGLLATLWVLFVAGSTPAFSAEPLHIDLKDSASQEQWLSTSGHAEFADGDLVLDGRRKICRAFLTPYAWADVTLSAEFHVAPAKTGVLACGFIVRAEDAESYYYVHFDRGQAILVKSTPTTSWQEIKRVGGLEKPAGVWHSAKLECVGNTLRVSLNGKLLYEAEDDTFKRGRIGFYGSQGLVRVRNISVAGTEVATDEEFRIPPPTFVHVCTDAGAGGYEAFPDVCRLKDGRLMTVFYAGYGHVALPNDSLPKGGRVCYCTSSDEGQTWSDAKVLYDGPDDDRDPSIVQLRDGRLICNFFSLRKSAAGGRRGYTPLGSFAVISEDLGKTWSEPQLLTDKAYCSSPIRELSTGRLILGLYTASDKTATGAVIYSDDGGKTWCDVIEMNNGGTRLDAETDLIELKDGRLLAALRPKMCSSISADQGATWTVAKPMEFAGHSPYFLRTTDDIIVLAHRLPQTSLHYSRDEGATWSKNVMIDGVIGAYPSMVNLKDGSVLVVYYEEGSGSSIRAKRFRISKDGVKFLPFAQRTQE